MYGWHVLFGQAFSFLHFEMRSFGGTGLATDDMMGVASTSISVAFRLKDEIIIRRHFGGMTNDDVVSDAVYMMVDDFIFVSGTGFRWCSILEIIQFFHEWDLII